MRTLSCLQLRKDWDGLLATGMVASGGMPALQAGGLWGVGSGCETTPDVAVATRHGSFRRQSSA